MGQSFRRPASDNLLEALEPVLDRERTDNEDELWYFGQGLLPWMDDDDDREVEPDPPGPPAPTFPDLSRLPPELALNVLSKLNATDLCLAACVWQQLASDDILWQGLCKEKWPATSVYGVDTRQQGLHYKQIYLYLDEGTLTFNSDPQRGMEYFFSRGLLQNDPRSIARFFHHTRGLKKSQVRRYLQARQDVLDFVVEMQNYQGQFLPNALRKCFDKLEAPNDRGEYLQELLGAFSRRFCECNPGLGYSADSVYVMCFSLILLSVDLTSPHVKNKMSKREFIRNTRNAVQLENNELFGEMYDNVFVRGHVSEECNKAANGNNFRQQRQFVPGYLAMFL